MIGLVESTIGGTGPMVRIGLMEVTGASPSTRMHMSNSFTATLDPMAGPGPSPTTGTNNLPP